MLHVLRSTEGLPFNQADIDLFNIFANQAGVALENARLLEETNRRVRQISILNDLTRAALTASDLQSMSQILAEQMGALVGADGCHLVLWDENESLAIPMAASGVLRGVYAQQPPRPGQMTLTESALRAPGVRSRWRIASTPPISAPRSPSTVPTVRCSAFR